jgi:hypothetical protein
MHCVRRETSASTAFKICFCSHFYRHVISWQHKCMDKTPSKDFTTKANSLTDWRGPIFLRLHSILYKAAPDMTEEVKWKKPSNPTGTPLFSHNGMVCTAESYKNYLKMTFAKGASLPDPAGLFNAPFTGATRRAINFYEGDKINEKALITLIRDAVAHNQSGKAKKAAKK